MSQRQKVIVGLGNPGDKYSMTRHNLGRLVIEEFVQKLGWSFKDDPRNLVDVAKGVLTKGSTSGDEQESVVCHFIAPKTYMNESGRAVQAYLHYYKLLPQDLIIVYDDIAIPFGELRVRPDGSSGGHNGLKSLELHLCTRSFLRLRMGIGEKPPFVDLADYVLSPFLSTELVRLKDTILRGMQVAEMLIFKPVHKVMTGVNAKISKQDPGSAGLGDK